MRRTRAALVALLALGASLLPTAGARAQTTYEVGIASFLSGAPAESMRFLPDRLRVHPGDIVHFTSESFHNALMLPANTGVQDWIDENASTPEDPFSLTILDPDDGTEARPAFKINNAVLFPSDFSCGTTSNPCAHDGTGVTNSGLPLAGPLDFSVQINAAPGDTIWVICSVHPAMRMKITVVGAEEETSDPAAVQQQVEDELALDQDLALAADKRLRRRTSHRASDGKVVDVFAGYDTGHISLLAFYPRKARVNRGQRVRFHFSQLYFETHTTTFGRDADEVAANFIVPVCDPDGDAGPGPDAPPDLPEPPFCADPSELEVDVHDDAPLPVGDGRHTGRGDFENSGVRGVDAPTSAPWTLRFTRPSNKRGFRYLCLIHPFMEGRVRVVR